MHDHSINNESLRKTLFLNYTKEKKRKKGLVIPQKLQLVLLVLHTQLF